MWLLPLSFFLKRNFSHRVQLGLHYQRKEAAAAAEGASRWKVSLVLFFSPRSRWKFTRNWKMNISDLCARQASLISSWKRWRWLRFLPKNWFLLAFRIHYKRSLSFLLFRRTSSPHTTAWAGWRGSCGRLKTKMAPGGKVPIPGRCEVQLYYSRFNTQPGPISSGWSALWLWEVRPIRNLDSLWRPGNRKTICHTRTRKYSCQP